MPFDPVTASQKARFIGFAYSMFEADRNSLFPPVDPGIAAQGFDVVSYLSAHDFQDVRFYGYLAAASDSPGDLILAIRGTETLQEWLLDFAALPLPYLGKGLVVAGFRAIAETFQLLDPAGAILGNLTDALVKRDAVTKITSITVLGHSLGGALATLAAAQIAFANPVFGAELSLWTYASPRVAFPDFMTAFNHAVPNTFRIWNTLDIVPEVPTFPFVHVGKSQQIKQTQAQIQRLRVNPACEHHLTTYEWLLNAPAFSLNPECELAAPLVAAHTFGTAVAAVSETEVGAAALARGLQQQP